MTQSQFELLLQQITETERRIGFGANNQQFVAVAKHIEAHSLHFEVIGQHIADVGKRMAAQPVLPVLPVLSPPPADIPAVIDLPTE